MQEKGLPTACGFSTGETEKLMRASSWKKVMMHISFPEASLELFHTSDLEQKKCKAAEGQLCYRDRVQQSPPEALGKDKERTKLAAAVFIFSFSSSPMQ